MYISDLIVALTDLSREYGDMNISVLGIEDTDLLHVKFVGDAPNIPREVPPVPRPEPTRAPSDEPPKVA